MTGPAAPCHLQLAQPPGFRPRGDISAGRQGVGGTTGGSWAAVLLPAWLGSSPGDQPWEGRCGDVSEPGPGGARRVPVALGGGGSVCVRAHRVGRRPHPAHLGCAGPHPCPWVPSQYPHPGSQGACGPPAFSVDSQGLGPAPCGHWWPRLSTLAALVLNYVTPTMLDPNRRQTSGRKAGWTDRQTHGQTGR